MSVAELQARVGLDGSGRGRSPRSPRADGSAARTHRARSPRYVNAVELAPGGSASHLAAAGRSARGPGGHRIPRRDRAAGHRGRGDGRRRVHAGRGPPAGRARRAPPVHPGGEAVARPPHDGRGPAEGAGDRAARRSGRMPCGGIIESARPAASSRPLLLQGMTGSGKTEVYLRAARRGPGARPLGDPPGARDRPRARPGPRRRAAVRREARHPALGARHGRAPPGVGAGAPRRGAGRARPPLGPLRAGRRPRPGRGRRGAGHLLQAGDRAALQRPRPRPRARPGRRRRGPPRLRHAEPREPPQRRARQARAAARSPSAPARASCRRGSWSTCGRRGFSRRPGEVHFSERLRLEIRRGPRGRRAGHPAAQPPRLRADAPLPRLRRGLALRGLRPAAHLPPPRPAPPLPLLRLDRSRLPERCPICGEEALEPIGAGTERVEEDFKELFPDAHRRRPRPRHRPPARRPGGPAGALRPRRDPGAHRHPDGLQGAPLPERRADRRARRRRLPGLPRLPRRRAHLQPPHPGGGPRRPRRAARPGRHPDLPSGPLRHPGRPARRTTKASPREEMRFRRVFHYPPYTRMVQLLVRDKNRDRAQTLIAEPRRRPRRPPARAATSASPAPPPPPWSACAANGASSSSPAPPTAGPPPPDARRCCRRIPATTW